MLTGVPKTALGVARIRARESERPDRLFNDPYAATFVAAIPDAYSTDGNRSEAARLVGARIAVQVVVRTRFYDDYLLAAVGDGIRQVVLLAAGLDTRAFRLTWPADAALFELDLPEMIAFKEDVLVGAGASAAAKRVVVPADLTSDWPAELTGAGFDPGAPTAWLIEGLLVYLTHDDAARLLSMVGALSAPGSRLSCEQGRGAMQLAARSSGAGASEALALWQGGIEDVPAWLMEHDWTVEIYDLNALANGYGRPVSTESQTGFVIASRS